ncbi:Fic family protein [Streptomyces sp. NPDC058440]|uniref:Fic family protein n=1 Tax=Streptomyces sp. NPDC058440 TaxID=3346501 RepID=UPI003668FC96
MTADHLRTWLEVREAVPWHTAPVIGPRLGKTVAHPPASTRDGALRDILAFDAARSPERSTRLLDALRLARADAAADRPLAFALLQRWQRHVLATDSVPFRIRPAYAKSGRERYGVTADLSTLLNKCLAQATDSSLPLNARAARAYLDICFFHPFEDGNARCAFLTLTYLLAREGIVLDQVAPVRRVLRRADDAEGALGLARVVGLLMRRVLPPEGRVPVPDS